MLTYISVVVGACIATGSATAVGVHHLDQMEIKRIVEKAEADKKRKVNKAEADKKRKMEMAQAEVERLEEKIRRIEGDRGVMEAVCCKEADFYKRETKLLYTKDVEPLQEARKRLMKKKEAESAAEGKMEKGTAADAKKEEKTD